MSVIACCPLFTAPAGPLDGTDAHLAWAAGPDGGLTDLNRQFHGYAGRPPAELLGRGWERLVHPDDRPGGTDRWARAVAVGGAFEAAARLRRHDGAYRRHLGRVARAEPTGRWVGT